MNQAVNILREDARRSRKCVDWYCVVFPIVEICITLGCFFAIGITNIKTTSEKIGLLGTKADILRRTCGTAGYNDPQAPQLAAAAVIDETSYFKELCIDFASVYVPSQVAACNTMKPNSEAYFKFLELLREKLPSAGTYAVQAGANYICADLAVECVVNSAYVCTKEFAAIANQKYAFTYPEGKQLFSTDDIIEISDKAGDAGVYIFQLCEKIGEKVVYEVHHNGNYTICKSDDSYVLTSIITEFFTVPKWVEYLFDYFLNISTYFIQEVTKNWKAILSALACSFGLSYLYAGIVLLITPVALIVTSGLLFFILLAIGVLMSIGAAYVDGDQFIADTFGYADLTRDTYKGLLSFGAAVFLFVGTLAMLYFISSIDEQKKLADALSVCKCVLKKRLRINIIPLWYIIMLTFHIAFCAILFVLVVFNGNYDSYNNVFTFTTIENYQLVTQTNRVVFVIFDIVYFFHGIFFFSAMMRWHLSSLTYNWFNERISASKIHQEDKNDFIKTIKGEASASKIQIKPQVSLAMINMKFSPKYFSTAIASHHRKTCNSMFRQVGTLIGFSLVQVIMFIPRFLLQFIDWLLTKSSFAELSTTVGKCSRTFIKTISYLVNLNSKFTVYYASLTSTSFFTATSHNHLVREINHTVYDDVQKITAKTMMAGKLIVAIVTVVIEQILEHAFIPSQDAFSFPISPVVICFILSILITSVVLSIIRVPNETLLLMFNYKQMLGQDPDTRLMPEEFTNLVDKYNLQGGKQSFTWKDTIKCVFQPSQ